MHGNVLHASSTPAPRLDRRSDGLLLVLAIGARLLASLLAPRSPVEPHGVAAPGAVVQPAE